MLAYLYSFLGVGGVAVLIWVVRSIKRWGAAKYKVERAEKERDEAEENASAWANKPRSFDDWSERMRARFKKNKRP